MTRGQPELTGHSFTPDMQAAVVAGNTAAMRELIVDEPVSNVTTSLAARLSARDFLVDQKVALSRIKLPRNPGEPTLKDVVTTFTTGADNSLSATLLTPYAIGLHGAKGGSPENDERFRKQLADKAMGDLALTAFMRHVSSLRRNLLPSPTDTSRWLLSTVTVAFNSELDSAARATVDPSDGEAVRKLDYLLQTKKYNLNTLIDRRISQSLYY